jgi:arginine N-succinyltransferase
VRRLLERIGFRYVSRVDPFDGGPHYEARLDEVTLVRAHRTARVAPEPLRGHATDALVAREARTGRERFRAVQSEVREEAGLVQLPRAARHRLGAEAGDRVHWIPF